MQVKGAICQTHDNFTRLRKFLTNLMYRTVVNKCHSDFYLG